jgi:hypothetical protein
MASNQGQQLTQLAYLQRQAEDDTTSVTCALWNTQTDNKNKLRFHTLLSDGTREVRFERVTS